MITRFPNRLKSHVVAIGGTQPAPVHVVAEGRYYYVLTATDDTIIIDPPDTTLRQSYDVRNIGIYVRYNMTDVYK
jgi:hypothetical protein